MSMTLRWIALKDAIAFNKLHHRHRPKVQGGIVALGCWAAGELVGIAIIGRSARMDKPDTVTITRVCTDGHANACSALYAKAKRVAQSLGFTNIKTFTELDEDGASLFAVGAEPDGITKGGSWDREGRPRQSERTEPKQRWRL